MLRPAIAAALSIVYLLIGALLLILAGAVGASFVTWDVKGFLLTGWRLALFSAALAGVALTAIAAAHGLWKGSRWSRLLAVGFWILAGSLGLITDRSVTGPGEPLAVYLLHLMAIPGGVAAVLLYGFPSARRFYADQDAGARRR